MADRAVISGVTGFVGRKLAQSLDRKGYELWGLSRDATRARRTVPVLDQATGWSTDADLPPSDAMEGASAVVHLAGESVDGRWTGAKKKRIEESRVRGTASIVRAIGVAQNRPSVLVSASAVGYYGLGAQGALPENSPAGDDFLARVCQGWEHEARQAEPHGVRVVRLRFGLVLGRGGALSRMLPIFRAGLGGTMGKGDQHWPWIHIDDVVGLIERAMADPSWEGAYNAVAPEATTNREFTRLLALKLSRPSFLPAPSFALRMALGGFASELLADRMVEPRAALNDGYSFQHPTLDGALDALLADA